jgi:arylsulfatase A-like enzyme
MLRYISTHQKKRYPDRKDHYQHKYDISKRMLTPSTQASVYGDIGGSNAPLRCGKGTTWEGGHRVPLIVWGPTVRRNAISNAFLSNLDLFPTILSLAELPLPLHKLDGLDFSKVLLDEAAKSPRTEFVFYAFDNEGTADAVRVGNFKVYFRTNLWLGGKEHSGSRPHDGK